MFFQVIGLAASVLGHGFMVHPGPLSEAKKMQNVRNYSPQTIGTNIDSMRNPRENNNKCRGISTPSPITKLELKNGQVLPITVAFSNNAQHVGPCEIEIYDPQTEQTVVIGRVENCARNFSESQPNTDLLGAISDQVCPHMIPPFLVTNDMCMQQIDFTIKNVEKVNCVDCVLVWNWDAQHVTPHEKYQQCADVAIETEGSRTDNQKPKHKNKNKHKRHQHKDKKEIFGSVCKSQFTFQCIDDKTYAACLEDNFVVSTCRNGSKCRQHVKGIQCL